MKLYVNDVGCVSDPALRHYTFDVPTFHSYGDFLKRVEIGTTLERIIMPIATKEIESLDYVHHLAESYDGKIVHHKDWYQVVFPPHSRKVLHDLMVLEQYDFI